MLGKHGTLDSFTHEGPIVATIRHADHTHAITLVPSPFGGALWDAAVILFNDCSFTVLFVDEVTETMRGKESFTHGEMMHAFGFDEDDVYGATPAMVVGSETIGHN